MTQAVLAKVVFGTPGGCAGCFISLEKVNKEQKQKLTDQNKSIKLSLNEIKSLEATIKNLNNQFGETQKQNETLKNEKASLKTSLVLKNREIQELESYIKGEEEKTNKIISEQEAEIKRLQKLKWYQKLFGRT